MLLNQAIQAQQDYYAQIQIQIEALQEQQRQIQAYLQRLGSIESKMESAAQLMQEAIADIREACPDELPAYEDLVIGFFQDAPVALLEGVEEVSKNTAIDDTPTEEQLEEESEESVTYTTDTTATEPDTTTIDVEAVTAVEPETAEEVETHTTFPTVDEVSKMKKADVTQWLDKFNLKYDSKVALKDLRAKLNVHLTFKNIELKENQSAA